MQTHQEALFKIKAVLRHTEKDHIENLEQHIEVIDSPYYSKTKTETAYLQNILKAIAYCHLRKDYRTFKIDNIKYLSITAIRYDKDHPKLQSFLNKVCQEQELQTIIIRVEKEVMKYLGEQKFYMGFVSKKETGDKIELVFLSSSLSGFARWYMQFGQQAEIIEPYELNGLVRKNLAALSENLK